MVAEVVDEYAAVPMWSWIPDPLVYMCRAFGILLRSFSCSSFTFSLGRFSDVCRCVVQYPPWRFDIRVYFLHCLSDVFWVLFDQMFQVGGECIAVRYAPVSDCL